MKTTQLRTLVAVAEHGTLMAAAEALCLSQPAVSKSIKELEARVGVQLLLRSGSGIRLTPYGEVLLRHARTVVAEIARAEQELEEMKSSVGRTLEIGVSLLAASIVVPDAIHAFRMRFPDVQLDVHEYQTTRLIDGLRDGSFDMCIGFTGEGDPSNEYRVTPLGNVSQSLAVKRGDPLAGEKRLARLREAHWLYNYTRKSVPAFWAALIARSGADATGEVIAPPSRMTVCTARRLYTELASEPGVVSVWPDLQLNEEIERGALERVALDIALPRLALSLIERKDRVLGGAAEYFIDCLKSKALPD
ncbi:HTH-type transcriptional regulator TsaR (plasmid) [Caballeronia sp. SBC1]|uniref:LysR family transcriptional regulator n=1 Tax=unclassified Caballeronia TaxID=2646786 RepID=UPI0013E14781|nr:MULTISPECIES: LysR family transcriptional regulator [unclassified Caballeronia]QIE25893.1 HTH-type transcriptional regulator TsaR [Caballeronia sp. SBC2]QIN64794.1 HTH-type transcriptional regulator TsaR [Caballeronia sp. SBC1]